MMEHKSIDEQIKLLQEKIKELRELKPKKSKTPDIAYVINYNSVFRFAVKARGLHKTKMYKNTDIRYNYETSWMNDLVFKTEKEAYEKLISIWESKLEHNKNQVNLCTKELTNIRSKLEGTNDKEPLRTDQES